MEVGEERVAPASLPLDRSAASPGRPEQERILVGAGRADAESAADIAGDDPDAVGLHAEGRRDRVLEPVDALARRMQREAPRPRIVFAERGFRLHRAAVDPLVVEGDPHDAAGRRERRFGRGRIARLGAKADIVPVPDPGGAQLRRGARVRHRGQGLVLDPDPLQRVHRRLTGFRHRHGDDLADMSDPVRGDGQGLRQRRNLVVGKPRSGRVQVIGGNDVVEQAREPVRRVVATGQHGEDTRIRHGVRGVRFQDSGVGVRRTEKRRVCLAGRVEIVAEPAPAGKKPAILLARHPFADHRTCQPVLRLALSEGPPRVRPPPPERHPGVAAPPPP